MISGAFSLCCVQEQQQQPSRFGLGVKNLQKTTRQCLKYQFCASAGSTSPLISQMSKLSDRLGDQSWVSLWVSCERQIYLSTADPRSVWIVRFPSSERTTEGFRTTHSSPLILCWRCRPQLYPESIHSFSNSFPARCPSPLRQNQGSGGAKVHHMSGSEGGGASHRSAPFVFPVSISSSR